MNIDKTVQSADRLPPTKNLLNPIQIGTLRSEAGETIPDTAADRHGRELPEIDPGSEGGGTTGGVTPGIEGTPGSDPEEGVTALTAKGAIASITGDIALSHRIRQAAPLHRLLALALAKGDAGITTVKSAPTLVDPV